MSTSTDISGFLRHGKDVILQAWAARISAEAREVNLTGAALLNDIPRLLDALADWVESKRPSEEALVAAAAFDHVVQRLESGLALPQFLREYSFLREAILEKLLSTEAAAQTKTSAASAEARAARIEQLARMNAGLDVVLSRSVEQFVGARETELRASEQQFGTFVAATSDVVYRMNSD